MVLIRQNDGTTYYASLAEKEVWHPYGLQAFIQQLIAQYGYHKPQVVEINTVFKWYHKYSCMQTDKQVHVFL